MVTSGSTLVLLCRLPPRGYCTLHLGILPLPGGLGTRRFEPLKEGSVDLCTIELLLSRGGSEVLKATTLLYQKQCVGIFDFHDYRYLLLPSIGMVGN